MSKPTSANGVLSSSLQAAANIATLIAASLLSIVLVKNYFLPRPLVRPTPITAGARAVSAGDNLKAKIPDVDWKANGETVLLALSTCCHSVPKVRQFSSS
ncbi:MAG TPA: hypothetical protein VKX25_20225 [Bryobacteraceae bacterium]|nr:hypothetical protein [Bryobacteraceae bacterium]